MGIQLSPVLRKLTANIVAFWCPACDTQHQVWIDAKGGWTWDGNAEFPTFNPSVKVTSGHFMDEWKSPGCWCTYNAEHPDEPATFKCGLCHSFVKQGRIQFLGDCSHALKGQTVPLPPWPAHRVI